MINLPQILNKSILKLLKLKYVQHVFANFICQIGFNSSKSREHFERLVDSQVFN